MKWRHTIVRLPPYHCFFNPIEMLWGYQKDLIQKESTVHTVKQAQTACEANFVKLPKDGLGPFLIM